MVIYMPVGAPVERKPSTNTQYSAQRKALAQTWNDTPERWVLETKTFEAIATQALPWYGHHFAGDDRRNWLRQLLVAVDFDDCTIPMEAMKVHYDYQGFAPWLGYQTLGGPGNYRLVWQCRHRIGDTYAQWDTVIKTLQHLGGTYSDKKAGQPYRLWQGGVSGLGFINERHNVLETLRF